MSKVEKRPSSDGFRMRERVLGLAVAGCYLVYFLVFCVVLFLYVDMDSALDCRANWSELILVFGPGMTGFAASILHSIGRGCGNQWMLNRLKKPKYWVQAIVVVGLSILGANFVTTMYGRKEIIGGVTWRYKVSGDNAVVGRKFPKRCSAISVSTSGALTIPSTLGGQPVTGIGEHAFSKCNRLTSVVIPNSVTNVEFNAFGGCRIEKIFVEKGDVERVKELLRGKGIDLDKVEFVERDDESVVSSAENPANGQVK